MEVQAQPLRRRPLQPRNFHWDLNPNPKPIEIEAHAGKENRPFEAIRPLAASLAEELGAVRSRRERLKLEREKTERLLKERERALESRFREMERRWGEQKKVELEIQRFIWVMDLRSLVVRVAPVQSLRAKEEETRDAQMKEANSEEWKESKQPSQQEEAQN